MNQVEMITELRNVGDVEPLDKFGPNLRSQAVAKHYSDAVLFFFRHLFGGQKVPTNFSNILSGSNIIFYAVFPKGRGGKLFPNHRFRSKKKAAAGGYLPARRVIEGKVTIDDVFGSEANSIMAGIHCKELARIKKRLVYKLPATYIGHRD